MCGIIAAFNTTTKEKGKATEVNNIIINQYQEQYSRGTEGFGIIRINKKQEIETDRACEPTKFLLDLTLKKSEMIIVHHRRPTSTKNKLKQTHPIIVTNAKLKYDYHIVHNGIISNDEELRKKHIELGFTYKTECMEGYYRKDTLKWNDSEALSIELALFIEKIIPTIRTNNTAAFIILQTDKKTKKAKQIFFGRSGFGDLKMSKTRGKLRISSEGEGDDIKPDILYSFKPEDPELKLTNQTIEFKEEEEKEETNKTIQKINEEIDAKRKIETIKQNQTNNTNEELRPYRSWINFVNDETIDYQQLSDPIDPRYTMNTCKKIKEAIKEASSNQISHIIDDQLDEQLDKAISLLDEYKRILLTDQLNKKTIEWYTNQMNTIMKTMTYSANIAEKIYEQVLLKEEELGYDPNTSIDDYPSNSDIENHHYQNLLETQNRLRY
jgi:predicted glutamine amidotransferase